MQRYDFYLILPNFYTLFLLSRDYILHCWRTHGQKINNPEYDRKIFDESESASLGIAAWIFGVFYLPADAPETASRRSDGYVPTQCQTRRDVATATSQRNFIPAV